MCSARSGSLSCSLLRSLVIAGLLLLTACTSLEDRGDESASVGDWDGAYGYYQQALAEDASNPILAGKLAEAEREAVAMHRQAARRARVEERYDDAIASLQAALRYGEREDVALELAELERLRDERLAARALAEASELATSKRLTAAERRARRSLELHATGEARALLAQIQSAQAAAQGPIERAASLEAAGRWSAAVSAYRQALAGWRDHQPSQAGLTRARRRVAHAALLAEGDRLAQSDRPIAALDAYRRARAQYDDAIVRQRIQAIGPRAAAAEAVTRAEQAFSERKLSATVAILEEALRLDRHSIPARALMTQAVDRQRAIAPALANADGLRTAGRWAEAIAQYDIVLEAWVDCEPAHAGRVACAAELDRADLIAHGIDLCGERRWGKAIECFEKAEAIRPDPVLRGWLQRARRGLATDALIASAGEHTDERQLTAASQKLERAARHEPRHPALAPLRARIRDHQQASRPHFKKARAAHDKRRYAEAITHYEAGLEHWADHPQHCRALELARDNKPRTDAKPRPRR